MNASSDRMTNRMDGKALSQEVRVALKDKVQTFAGQSGFAPGLAVCLVGENPASQIYVRKKGEACAEVGIESFQHHLPKETSTQDLLSLIDKLNVDAKVHGILVQLPLPDQVDAEKVLERVSPAKDVDGFHPENVGRLMLGKPRFVPCTPLGMMRLLEKYQVEIKGKHAVIVGRSNIVGKPISQLLLAQHATVTICHSRTSNLQEVIASADILVAAVGKAKMIPGDWVKPGAVVLDVGINRLDTGKLVGDVDFETAAPKAKWITPVPGGVGPMTIAMLLENTLLAAKLLVR